MHQALNAVVFWTIRRRALGVDAKFTSQPYKLPFVLAQAFFELFEPAREFGVKRREHASTDVLAPPAKWCYHCFVAGNAYRAFSSGVLMTYPTVDYVLELIDQMPEEDRLALELRLSQRLDAVWDAAVAENRNVAEARGITDESIDRAIHRRRYGE